MSTLKEVFQAWRKNLLLDAHPVGSLYWSSNATDPTSLFGGSWERIKDKFILAAGDSYSRGSTGGEAVHTLSVSEMPSHTHTQYVTTNINGGSMNTRIDFNADAQNVNIYPQCNVSYTGGVKHTTICHHILSCTVGGVRRNERSVRRLPREGFNQARMCRNYYKSWRGYS